MAIELNEIEDGDVLMTPAEVSRLLRIPVQTLSLWRMTGAHGLKFAKIGHSVRYRKSDLISWMEARSGTSLAELAANAEK